MARFDQDLKAKGSVEARVLREIKQYSPLASIEALTSPNLFPRLGILGAFARPLRSFLEFSARQLLGIFRGDLKLGKLRDMRNSKKDRFALIVASGPSAAGLDEQRISQLRREKQLDVFGINNVANSSSVSKIGFDYLVVSDPGHDVPVSQLMEATGFKDSRSRPKAIFIPRHFRVARDIPNAVPFEDKELSWLGLGIRPDRPRRYLSLTALKGMAIADFLGYKKIFVVGLDGSMFLTVKVDQHNIVTQQSNHVDKAGGPDADQSFFYPNGLMDYFFSTARYFFHLKKYFSARRFVNLDPNSFTDGLPKEDPMNMTRLWG